MGALSKIRVIQQKTQEVLDSRQRQEQCLREQEVLRKAKEEQKALQRRKIDEIKEQSQAAKKAVKALEDSKKAAAREARAERLSRELTLDMMALDEGPVRAYHEVAFAFAAPPGEQQAALQEAPESYLTAVTPTSRRLSAGEPVGVGQGQGYSALRTSPRGPRSMSLDCRLSLQDEEKLECLQREERELLGRIHFSTAAAGMRPPRPQLQDAAPARAVSAVRPNSRGQVPAASSTAGKWASPSSSSSSQDPHQSIGRRRPSSARPSRSSFA